MTSRLLVLVFIAIGTLFANSIDYTLTETTADNGDVGNACIPSCQTFEFVFPDWSPYALDGGPIDVGTTIRQLDFIAWTFTDGNPADRISERVDYTGTYTAPDLAPYLGSGFFAIDVTPTDPGPAGTLGTLTIKFDQHNVPFTTPYDGPPGGPGAVVMVSTGPVAMPESSLPLEMLVLLAGVAILAKWQRLSTRYFG
jgi:hypothetical protein